MIRLIAAIDRKRGIAKNGGQPWNIPHDEQYFLQQTSQFGSNVLMGSKTFEVIGHPLRDRRNFVLSADKDIQINGVEMVHDLEDFLKNFTEDIWVVGGATVFEQTLKHADELYLTHIDSDFGCQQLFPEYESSFQKADHSELHEENGFIFTYNIYRKQ